MPSHLNSNDDSDWEVLDEKVIFACERRTRLGLTIWYEKLLIVDLPDENQETLKSLHKTDLSLSVILFHRWFFFYFKGYLIFIGNG
jgi:hypothetical protein